MEDGPEAAEGSYEHDGKTYRLLERESEQWLVFDGDRLLGTLAVSRLPSGERGPHYTVMLADESTFAPDTTDDWDAALQYLIHHSEG